jgi:hypothetical protein
VNNRALLGATRRVGSPPVALTGDKDALSISDDQGTLLTVGNGIGLAGAKLSAVQNAMAVPWSVLTRVGGPLVFAFAACDSNTAPEHRGSKHADSFH